MCSMFPAKYKLTLYSLLALISLVAGLEFVLRIAGFEFHAPTFIPPAPPCMVLGSCNKENNSLFGKKGAALFLRPEYSGWFQEQNFPARKPKNEFRVFILGGSTIYNLYGHLENSYNDSGMRVRIVNIGGNSFGTGRLVPLFGEILGYDPDMIIIYSGHSEFVDITIVDDFLLATPFQQKVREILRPSRVCNLIELAVYKTGMTLMRMKKIHGNGVVRYFSSRMRPGTDKDKVYGLYREYITSMVKKALEHNISLRLSTVAYNRIIPPVNPAEAKDMNEKGLALMREGKYKEALIMLDKAQDAEKIPFGANETSNKIIRDIAGKYKVPLLDVDAAVILRAPNGIPGNETFLDQCHFVDSRFLGELFQKEIHSAIAERKNINPGI